MDFCFLNEDARYKKPKYKFGKYTYHCRKQPLIIEDYWIGQEANLNIGSFCSIAKGVRIWLGGNHKTNWITTAPINHYFNYDTSKGGMRRYSQIDTKGSVTIGNDVWIGAYATIMSGVTIGDGAVIGTMSVVAKDIPPYAVAVGNPVRVIRKRFDDEMIEKLLEIKWWNWDESVIKENIPLLLSGNLEDLIKKAEEIKVSRNMEKNHGH